MENFLHIPVTLSFAKPAEAFKRVSVEESIKESIRLLVLTKKGECLSNPDFGYEIWSNEFEPILNIQKWQPVFIEQIKSLIEKNESRIIHLKVGEPEIKSLSQKRNNGRDYRITLNLSYKIEDTGESVSNMKISFDY